VNVIEVVDDKLFGVVDAICESAVIVDFQPLPPPNSLATFVMTFVIRWACVSYPSL
jgi:hypothetical protein